MEISSDAKFVIGIFLVTVLVIGGGAYLASKKTVDPNGRLISDALLDRLVREDSPSMGQQDAKVTVVEFGDFQCPSCGSVYPIIKALEEKYTDQSVRFVFRHYPLPQHENAFISAEAAVEAHKQGKFWEYHDTLFENQLNLKEADLLSYAQQVGLDVPTFQAALTAHTHKDTVQRDISDGSALAITGTPTIFINNRQYTGSYSLDALSQAIDTRLAE